MYVYIHVYMLYLRLCAFDVHTWTTNKIKKVAVKIEKAIKLVR